MPVLPNALTNLLASILALVGGLALGYVDLQTSEVVVTLGVLFVFNMVLGALAPRGGWFWPVITALGVLTVNWFPQIVGTTGNPYLNRTFSSYLLLALMLMVAGTAGMLFGVVVRRSLHVPAE